MFQIQGKITKINPPINGISKTGSEWMKQNFFVESVEGDRIKKYIFGVWNQSITIPAGTDVVVLFDITCNEYQDKYFTNLEVKDIKPIGAFANAQSSMVPPQAPVQQHSIPQKMPQTYTQTSGKSAEDLPF